jgi:4-diphosphocytidyl-2-C-methyl-D-erythritol kinase
MKFSEPAPAKLNLALHVRGRRRDGRHDIETLFAFCTDGDVLHAETSDRLSLTLGGPFGDDLDGEHDNLVLRAAQALAEAAGVEPHAALHLDKRLPVASGIGGGSADAAAALRLLTRLWSVDPAHASSVAPKLGADVPACLLSMTSRGEGVGEELALVDDPSIAGTPVLLVNPLVALSTAAVFSAWDEQDRGPLGDWREGRNDLEAPAIRLVPEIADVLEWLGGLQRADMIRMSGSGATCFALFEDEGARDEGATTCPPDWWHLATFLR